MGGGKWVGMCHNRARLITLYKTFCLPKTNKKEQKLYHTFVPNME